MSTTVNDHSEPKEVIDEYEGETEEKEKEEQSEQKAKEEGEKTPEFKPRGILKKPGQEPSRTAPTPIQIDAPPEDENRAPRKIYRTQTGWIKKEDLPEEMQENFVERRPQGDAKCSLKPKNALSLKNSASTTTPPSNSSSNSTSSSTSTSAPSSASSSPSSSASGLKSISKSPTTSSKSKVLSKKSHSHNDISKASLSEQDLKMPKKKDLATPALKKERPQTEKEKCTVS